MNEETLSKIFEKFYQGETSHNQEGNGLGLSIVKRIITLHNGSIEVESKLKEFIDTLKTVKKIDVLPYHTMGELKYNNLGIEYPLKGVRTPSKEEIINVKKILGVIKNDN